jgi:hypothetical protein
LFNPPAQHPLSLSTGLRGGLVSGNRLLSTEKAVIIIIIKEELNDSNQDQPRGPAKTAAVGIRDHRKASYPSYLVERVAGKIG